MKLVKGCNLLPQDMFDTDGQPFVDEEMMKALESATEEGQKFMAGILYSMQEANERTEVKDAVIMQTMSMLTKSVAGMHGIIVDMQKSVPEIEELEVDGKLPNLGDKSSKYPWSQTDSLGGVSVVSREDAMQGLKKAYPCLYGDDTERLKKEKYADLIGKHSFDVAMGMIPSDDQRLIRSHLPN